MTFQLVDTPENIADRGGRWDDVLESVRKAPRGKSVMVPCKNQAECLRKSAAIRTKAHRLGMRLSIGWVENGKGILISLKK